MLHFVANYLQKVLHCVAKCIIFASLITIKIQTKSKKAIKKMKLTTETLEIIKQRKDCKNKLMTELHLSQWALLRYLRLNPPYSPLTSVKASEIISQNLNKPVNELYQ